MLAVECHDKNEIVARTMCVHPLRYLHFGAARSNDLATSIIFEW
jgi:hypothetical protein